MSSTRGHFEGLFGALPVRPDRRAHTRSNSALLAYVELGDGNGGIALNVSGGGLAITAAGLLMSDYFPSIRFQLPMSDVWIEASGQVAWMSASKKAAGIEFMDLADSEREKISEWIATKDFANGQIQPTGETIDERDMGFLRTRTTSKHPVKNRKLEVLSEADEAKFAGMFPSEKYLPNVHKGEVVTQNAEPRIAEQNWRNVLQFSEQNLERSEPTDTSKDFEPTDEPTQEDMTPALMSDGHSVEEETPPTADFPAENSFLVSLADASCEAEQPRAGESEPTQPEKAEAEQGHNNSTESESLQPADFAKTNPSVATEADESSEVGKGAASGKEQERPIHVFSREADLIQQLELHRRNRASNLLMGQERELPVEHRSGWPLAALILVIGIAFFAVGVGVGNGFFEKLLGRDKELEQQSDTKPANLPATTAGENDFAGGSAVAGNAQKSAEVSPGNSAVTPPNNTADTATNDSPAESTANADAPVQAAPTVAPITDSGHGGNLAAKDSNVSDDASGYSPDKSLFSDATARGAANDPRATPGTKAISPAAAANARPVIETQASMLVTAPEERSGPYRMALEEQAVSASRTLAISAQRFVSIPAQPGSASHRRPERLQVGALIFHVDPLVPTAGNQRELAGTVRVRATVGKNGDVVDVRAISGPALLIPAVVRAVREWRYAVTLLDGQPLGAEEDVVVEFRPSN